MSDMGRKDMGDKLKEGVTPDSQKSMLDKTKESATDTYDKAASSVQPSDDKSMAQKASDTVSGGSKPGDKSILEQGQDMLTQGVQYAQDTVNAGIKSVQDATNSK